MTRRVSDGPAGVSACQTGWPTPCWSVKGHAPRGYRPPGPHEHRQDAPRHRADADAPDRHDRVPAAAPGAGELRPRDGPAGEGGRRPRNRRGAHRPAKALLLDVHGRGDAARPQGGFPRGGRGPARRRPRARPRLHRPHPGSAGPPRDLAPRRRDHPAAPPQAAPGRGLHHAAAALHPERLRAEAPRQAPAPLGRDRLLGARALRGGGASPPRAGRGRARVRRPLPPHPQRPGGALPGRGGGPPGGDRRDWNGSQPRHRPRGLHRTHQVRRRGTPPAHPGRGGPGRGTGRPPRPRRPLRVHHRAGALRPAPGGGGGEAPLRAPHPPLLADRRARLLLAARAPRQPRPPAAAPVPPADAARRGPGGARRPHPRGGGDGARARPPPRCASCGKSARSRTSRVS